MKALFIVFYGFNEYNGISKKIKYQVNALIENGIDVRTCYYEVTKEGYRQWFIDHDVLINLGKGIRAKLKKRIDFSPLIHYVIKEKISFVYIRSYHNANPFTIHFVKALKKLGVKICLEIPTYPYDQEYSSGMEKIQLYTDKLFRHAFCKYIDAIITYSNDEFIFGKRTIRISNGIDFKSIPLRKQPDHQDNELHLIGVAEIHFWHGFDRLIKGMGLYYQKEQKFKVFFHLVGDFSGVREQNAIVPLIKEYGLESYVTLYGNQHGQELDNIFNSADLAIGSLARHRSGITALKSLKNREYAARGFAFIYSENDDDFDNMPYIQKVPADETPINIFQLIDFYRSQRLSPEEIRNSITKLSWNEQMKKIVKDPVLKIL